MDDPKAVKKELAKLKRQAAEIAGQIHDIVEETLWSDYHQLPQLSAQIIEAIEAANRFKQQHGL